MKIKIYALLFLSILTISCSQKGNNSIGNNNEESVFQEVNRTKSQFEIRGDSYQYLYKGNIKNSSSNIFDSVSTTVEVEILLENGNVITERDYQTILFGGGMDFKYSWKPKETLLIDNDKSADLRLRNPLAYPDGDKGTGLGSEFIPSNYKDYPIKKVVAILCFKTTDVINQTNDTYQTEIDITKEWNELK